jgi:hypothetical protein
VKPRGRHREDPNGVRHTRGARDPPGPNGPRVGCRPRRAAMRPLFSVGRTTWRRPWPVPPESRPSNGGGEVPRVPPQRPCSKRCPPPPFPASPGSGGKPPNVLPWQETERTARRRPARHASASPPGSRDCVATHPTARERGPSGREGKPVAAAHTTPEPGLAGAVGVPHARWPARGGQGSKPPSWAGAGEADQRASIALNARAASPT